MGLCDEVEPELVGAGGVYFSPLLSFTAIPTGLLPRNFFDFWMTDNPNHGSAVVRRGERC